MSAIAPEMVMEEDPSVPASKVRPVVWARVMTPSAVRVTVAVSSSTSLKERPVTVLPVEFTAKDWPTGVIRTGRSLAPLMVTVAVAVAVPPKPSLTV